MNRIPVVIFLSSLIIPAAFSYGNPSSPFSLETGEEIMILSAAGLANAASYIAGEFSNHESAYDYGTEKLDKNDIPFFDRWALHSYSEGAEITGEIFHYSLLASPLLLFPGKEFSDIAVISVMYCETILFTEGVKNLTKSTVARYRPYSYYHDTDTDMLDDPDSAGSFFSGHTARSFASASFFTYVYSRYSGFSLSVAASAYTAAALSGAMRVYSGNHFFSDVVTGALFGTFTGLFIPYLHDKSEEKKFPFGFITSYDGNPACGFDFSPN